MNQQTLPLPHIRIFPHATEEYLEIDTLLTWLATALPARAYRYRLRRAEAVRDLTSGSVVLFRYGNAIVAEGVVREYVRESGPHPAHTAEQHPYEAQVWFVPGSIRFFSPPFPVAELHQIVLSLGGTQNIMPAHIYHIIENWNVYPRMLAAHSAVNLTAQVQRAGSFI